MCMISRQKFILLALIAFLLSGCYNTFALVDKDYVPKGKTIAVIPGINDNMNKVIGQLFAQSLAEESRYNVMSTKRMTRALGTSAVSIQGPYRSAYFDIDVDWSMTDKDEVAALQRSLKTDYVYMFWAPTAVNYNNSKAARVHVIAQMFEFPGMKLVGQGRYILTAAKDDPNYLKRSARKAAMATAKKSGMLRQ